MTSALAARQRGSGSSSASAAASDSRCDRRASPPPAASRVASRAGDARAVIAIPRAIACGPSSITRGACSAVGVIPSRPRASSSAARKSGLPPDPVCKRGGEGRVWLGPEALAREGCGRILPRRPGRIATRCWIGSNSVTRGGDVRLLGRPRSCEQDERQTIEPMSEVREPAQRRLVGPVQIVDDEQRRRARGEVRCQPVEAVQHRERGLGAVTRCVVGVESNSEALSPAAPLSSSARTSGAARRAAPRTAAGRSRTQTRPPARRHVRSAPRIAASASARASRSSRVLPIPALPSTTTRRPPPSRATARIASSAASSASRSRSGAGGGRPRQLACQHRDPPRIPTRRNQREEAKPLRRTLATDVRLSPR